MAHSNDNYKNLIYKVKVPFVIETIEFNQIKFGRIMENTSDTNTIEQKQRIAAFLNDTTKNMFDKKFFEYSE